ncbi:hypothetical protein RFI_08789 [Reticulomyxa filosa]|uniref:Uncharacterized protein n=1 Tax=Reticulomyxa filosa TaxID=46433 RepID=X6NSR5_RETFI|nr:hypothetical protein RFI_08789 [Reticulomyxa filosa]|eukprot:ETO28347.1 hypothetical protein RFI_08789 [Reticulomyxa filosa]
MQEVFTNPDNMHWLVNRPALGNLPPIEFPEKIKQTLMSVAPKGLDQVQLMMCGTCSNENALKHAMMYHQHIARKGKSPSDKDLLSSMWHQSPGTPDHLLVIAFEKAFHGRTFMSLSLSQSKAIHKVDVPAMTDTVLRCPFPNTHNDKGEDDRTLAGIEQMIRIAKETGLIAHSLFFF